MLCHVNRLQSSSQMAVQTSFWDIQQGYVTNGGSSGMNGPNVTNGKGRFAG